MMPSSLPEPPADVEPAPPFPEKLAAEIRHLQIGFAVFLTVAVVILHVLVLRNAGGLWRDEANKAQFALMPSLATIFSSLRYDSSPIGSVLFFRFWALFNN